MSRKIWNWTLFLLILLLCMSNADAQQPGGTASNVPPMPAGIPPPKVLQLATLGAARIMKRDVELGSITPGKLADLVLIDGNPATNIGDVRKTSLTMKDGVIYKPAELYSELGILP